MDAGKGSKKRESQISSSEEERRYAKAFGNYCDKCPLHITIARICNKCLETGKIPKTIRI